jgi:hypothetical protein
MGRIGSKKPITDKNIPNRRYYREHKGLENLSIEEIVRKN